MNQEFLRPKLVGERFNQHSIPLEVLKDLSVLEEMITEVARSKYLQDHPERKRVPKGFTQGVELKLSDINEGSAIPVIMLVIAGELFLPEVGQYFEKARDSVVQAVAAAENGSSITEHLPSKSLGYFDRIGRSLLDEEAIEFPVSGTEQIARQNRTTRKRLIEVSEIKEYTEELTLRGIVPELDQSDMTFEIQLVDAKKVKVCLTDQHLETVLDAFNHFKDVRKIRIDGIGKFTRNGNLSMVESLEHVSVLDPLDVSYRLEELAHLKQGWLDGEGVELPKEGLKIIEADFIFRFPDDKLLPHIFPTPNGGLQLEWSTLDHEMSLEVDLNTRKGHWTDVYLETDDLEERDFDLNKTEDWEFLLGQIPVAEEGSL